MDDLQRQFRVSVITLVIIIPVGIIGFMMIEGKEFLDAAWLTIITLTTIGYGDIYATTGAGRLFTIFLVLVGMGAILFALQTSFAIFASPTLRDVRIRRRTQKLIQSLNQHHIICGEGELVDKTINYLIQYAAQRHKRGKDEIFRPIDRIIDRLFGDDEEGKAIKIHQMARRVYLLIIRPFHSKETLLDAIVVITQDKTYAEHLRNEGLLVITGDPSDEDILEQAGIQQAQSLMVVLDSDTETLLTTLTANKLNPNLHITAEALEESIQQKMIHVGANNVIAPYEVAGQFLNNATLRPAVNEYFYSLLFESATHHQLIQFQLWDDCKWIGKRLSTLSLREKYDAGVIGVRRDDGSYLAAPGDDYILNEDDILMIVVPTRKRKELWNAYEAVTNAKIRRFPTWQALPTLSTPPTNEHIYTLEESETAIEAMSQHFVICGSGRVARNAINKLDPARPFVIISNEESFTETLLNRGFRVIHGNPTDTAVLKKAGVHRAQAIMVTIEEKADSVLTVLTCRELSKRLLITATANSDDMIDKIERAGADRVVSPFHVAAQFVLLSSTRPEISAFVQHVLYNYHTQLETAELYMENDSPWIGQTIESLRLDRLFQARIIGVRLADRETYIYAPPVSHVIKRDEVLIVVTPMANFDELRATSYGSTTKRPITLRRKVLESGAFSHDMIRQLVEQVKEKNS